MKVGLTGFAGAGKTTVFSALTGLTPDPADRKAHVGTIKVPDPRIDFLATVYSPKKATYSEVTFVDFPPTRSAQPRAVLDQETVTGLRDAEALVEVVRGFPDVTGDPARPLEDIDAFDGELILADLGPGGEASGARQEGEGEGARAGVAAAAAGPPRGRHAAAA